jgi:hypothetical protein
VITPEEATAWNTYIIADVALTKAIERLCEW